MPKTKDDRRSRRKEGGELSSKPYNKASGNSNNAPGGGGRRGYIDGDRKGGKRHNNKNNQDDEHAPCASFDAMNLKPDLLKGIYAYGFEKPSAIQQRAIKPIVRGRDVIAQSQSGTGKTVR